MMIGRTAPLVARSQHKSKLARRSLAAPLALCTVAVLVFALLQAYVHGRGLSFSGKVSISGGLFLATAHLHNIPIHGVLPETANATSDLTEVGGSARATSNKLEISIDSEEDSASLDPAVHLFGGTPQVAALERELHEYATLGFCVKGKPLLPAVPPQVCQELFCLWSHALKADIDLSFSMLQLLPQGTTPHRCPIAQGGQVGTIQLEGSPPMVSLILLAGKDDLLAAQTFVQLFRTAHEAPSAEFVVVGDPGLDIAVQQEQQDSQPDGPVSDSERLQKPASLPYAGQLLRAAAKRVGTYFGAQLKLVSAETVLGAGPPSPSALHVNRWAQAQAGLRAASGQYAVIIPAGTFGLRGWLHALLQTFQAHPHAGMIGPLVLSGSDVVRDAGGVLFQDGSFSLAGAGKAPTDNLLHLRQVDFVGPSCVALKRDEALAAGGWDLRLDGELGNVDLALALQARGLSVLLQPLSVVLAPHLQRPDQGGAGVNVGESDLGGSLGRQGAMGKPWQEYTVQLSRVRRTDSRAEGSYGMTQQANVQPPQQLQVLQQKWDSVLKTRFCPPPPRHRAPWRSAPQAHLGGAAAAPRVLWIDDTVPTPDKDSGSVRLMALISILVEEGFDVSFQPRRDADKPYNLAIQAAGVRVLPANPLRLQSRQPQTRSDCLYDAFVVARRPNYNRTVSLLDEACPGVPQIFDTVDLHFLREARDEMSARGLHRFLGAPELVRWLRSGAQLLAKESPAVERLLRHQDKELELIAHAHATLVVSEEELEVVKHYLPEAVGRVHLVSNVYQAPMASMGTLEGQGRALDPSTSTCQSRKGLLFVGNYNHKPNADAVVFLVQHVLPRIRKKLPRELVTGAQAHIVGSGALPRSTESLLRNNFKFVQYHGYLPNDLLQVLYSSVKVAVAPLTTGAGVKGKVNQAMQLGVPMVATSIAVEGMHAEDGKHCLIGDTAEELAEKIVAAYTNCTLWDSLVVGGRANLQQHFSLQTARDALLGVLRQAGVPGVDRHQHVDCGRQQVF